MKAGDAPSTIDIGVTAAPRREVASRGDDSREKFEETFVTASRQRTGRPRHRSDAPPGLDERTSSEKPRHPHAIHRGSLQRALAALIAHEASGSEGREQSVSGKSVHEEKESGNLVDQRAEPALVMQLLPMTGFADKAAMPNTPSAVVNQSRPAGEARGGRLPLVAAAIDDGHKIDDVADTPFGHPAAKVVGEEVHFAPVTSRGIDGISHRIEDGSETHADERQDRARREGGERNIRMDAGAAGPGAGNVDRKQDIIAHTDVAIDEDAAVRAAPSAATVQVLDGLLGKGDLAGAHAERPTSNASQADDKPLFSPFVRSLKIQLAPESLGIVNVVVARGDSSLRIRLEADVAETRNALIADRDSIGRHLETIGLRVDEVVVMRSGDSSNGAMSDTRSATASGGTGESYSGQRSEQGQSRQPPRTASDDPTGHAKAEETSDGAAVRVQSVSDDRFLGRRTLRSV